MVGLNEGAIGAPGWFSLRFQSLSPTSGSMLTAWSLEPASDSVSPSLSLPLPHSHSVSLSKINKHKKILNYSFFQRGKMIEDINLVPPEQVPSHHTYGSRHFSFICVSNPSAQCGAQTQDLRLRAASFADRASQAPWVKTSFELSGSLQR